MGEELNKNSSTSDDTHVSADDLSRLYERQSRRYDSDLDIEDDS